MVLWAAGDGVLRAMSELLQEPGVPANDPPPPNLDTLLASPPCSGSVFKEVGLLDPLVRSRAWKQFFCDLTAGGRTQESALCQSGV